METPNNDDLSLSNILFRLTSKSPDFFNKLKVLALILLTVSGVLYYNAGLLGFTESFTTSLHYMMIISASIAGTSQLTKK
jgi:hypothetical protein